ncbi:ATP-binding cassette domain-containing protein [Actinoplanes sp. NPDC023936]|uniref:ATP-binding cassette domain-containing protein n=1 Tax=Actinoplanes sp. NPDC023936 TaxID=3154910 RepID=UPI0033CE4DF2
MRFEGIWFRYARRAPWALRNAEATVDPGSVVVVLGHNGAGKSTLLQLAAGVLRPVRGTIRDRPAVVGWVPERFPAALPFSCAGYLRSMAAVRGVRQGAADEWIERLGLAAHAETPLADLSKGTAQKVGLAQALLTPPGLLVLDEPWEGLDAASRSLVPEIVAEVTGHGGVVLVSDHRGEIASLPGAAHWTVTDGELRVTDAPAHVPAQFAGGAAAPADEVIVEVAVRRQEAAAAVAGLRASGHRVIGVRPTPAPAEQFPTGSGVTGPATTGQATTEEER